MVNKKGAFTAAEFVELFSSINDNMWRTGHWGYKGVPRCVMGHCFEADAENKYDTILSRDLASVFKSIALRPEDVNDGCSGIGEIDNMPSPKARILKALEKCIEREQK